MPEKRTVYVVVYNDFDPFQTNVDVFSTMSKAAEQVKRMLNEAIEEQTCFETIEPVYNPFGVLIYFSVKTVEELSYECFIRAETIQ